MDLTFKVILEWDSEEQVFVVSVPSLPGCYTQGKNRPEALERIREAIDGHIKALRSAGLPVPEGAHRPGRAYPNSLIPVHLFQVVIKSNVVSPQKHLSSF
jgi:predicted RNase H-like HicB family nuclease